MKAEELATLSERVTHFKQFPRGMAVSEILETNRSSLNNPQFRKFGLTASSDSAEAGYRHVIVAREKQSGMYWTVPGADAVINL